jgi:hypothetical protein
MISCPGGFRLGIWLAIGVLLAAFSENQVLAADRSADSDDTLSKYRGPKITTLGYVTWWSHDAIGYHPAIYLKLENNSATDLTGVIVHFQARFTDLRNGYVTVARQEKRRDFLPHQQVSLMLRGPKAWELPIDASAWPTIECKVMCRVADAGDEGTQELGVTRLDEITMTDDEALAQLTEQTGVGRVSRPAIRDPDLNSHQPRHEHVITAPAKALVATAGTLLGTRAKPEDKQEKAEKRPSTLALPQSLPGLGDDFYSFDKFYGLPFNQGVVPSKSDLTWVNYPGKSYFSQVLVGSRGASGKADLIVVTVAGRPSPKEAQLATIAKLLAGKYSHGQNPQPFAHSVRYLSSGRSEILRSQGQEFHVIAFSVPNSQSEDGIVAVAVSRLPGDLEALLAGYARRISMLSFLLPGLSPDTN